MATLAVHGLSKSYGKKMALRDVNLDIGDGEFFCMLGPSGAGKTTTLKSIAGLQDIDAGVVTIAGVDMTGVEPYHRNVAMAFETYSLYPPLTNGENIAFALKAQKLSAMESSGRVKAIADMLEISDILNKYPSSVSGGQQQRVSLGRALVRDASLYLLDEPMGQLEPRLRAVLRGRIKHYLRENKCTTILVTHDQTEANALADRIAVMEGGVLQQYATPAELKVHPANLFTGTFIGEPLMLRLVRDAWPDATEAETDRSGEGHS